MEKIPTFAQNLKLAMSKDELMVILSILGSLSAGLGIGFFLRGKNLTKLGKLITILIWVLLFCLGVKVGVDDTVVDKLPIIGMEALLITIGAIAGSIFFAWGLWRLLDRSNKS